MDLGGKKKHDIDIIPYFCKLSNIQVSINSLRTLGGSEMGPGRRAAVDCKAMVTGPGGPRGLAGPGGPGGPGSPGLPKMGRYKGKSKKVFFWWERFFYKFH